MSQNSNDTNGLGALGRGLFSFGSPAGLGAVGNYGSTPGPLAPSPSTSALAAALRDSIELHTNPSVAHIAGIGASHPDRLSNEQVQSLCGEVLRHIRRMEGRG